MTEPARGPAELSSLDSLTGLWNRRALLAALRERLPSGQGTLIMVDLDNFAQVNERIGREFADRLLLDIAGRLMGSLPSDPLLYRYSGDAFCVLLPDVDREHANSVAESLIAALSASPFAIHDRLGPAPGSVALTASAGVASYPTDARTPSSLVEATERALYVAKHAGRNRVAVTGRLDPAILAEIGVFRGLPCPIFVGRAAEQARLRQLATSSREVGVTMALVGGPPGIGKSRLLQEVCRWAKGEQFVVLAALCSEPRLATPYAAASEQIERLMTTDRIRTLEAIGRLTPIHQAALAVIIRDFPVPKPMPDIEAVDRGRITFDAFGVLLDELAKGGPLLIALDEVEWADEVSLELYRLAIERRVPLVILATADRLWTELEQSPVWELFKVREKAVTRLVLGPMAPEDVRQMISAILPDADLGAEAVEQLVVAAGGNPLYVEETVRMHLLKGRLKLVEGRWQMPTLSAADLPKSLDEAIREVAGLLPPGANWLLTRAAVIGGRVDTELLQEVLGQREAEALEFIDEARRARLLVTSDSEEDVLSFPASHARRVRLQNSDALEKKAIHGRVGVVQEARHGGEVGHLAGELAYHYGRAGEDSRARHFESVAARRAALVRPPQVKGVRRARIQPVTQELPAAAREQALTMMRHWKQAIQIGRLYPQWSQIFGESLAQVRKALESALKDGPGFTVAPGPSGPVLNGAPCEAAIATDFVAMLDERLVESITFLPAFDPGRLEAVLRAFVTPFDRVRVASDHWDRFLNREKLEAVDVVQKAYRAQETKLRGQTLKGDQPIPPEEMGALRDVTRGLKAAVDNLKLYPPGHPLVEESAALACKSTIEFVMRVNAVAFGTAEGDLVVNGMPADKKFFSDAGAWLVREIEQRELKSFTIWRGLVEDEVRALISFLSMKASDVESAGDAFLGQFVHVAFGSLKYERAKAGAQAADFVPPPKPIRAELRARTYLGRPYDRFLGADLDREFPTLVEALTYGAGKPLAEQLVDRLGEHFHDETLSHRRQGFRLLERSLAYASPSTRALEVTRSANPLRQRLSQDTATLHFRAAADVLPVWVPAAATAGCMKELSEILGQTVRKRFEAPDTPPEVRGVCELLLQMVLESRAYERICATVRKPQEADRRAAITILMALGAPARRELVESIIDEPDREVRKGLATAIAPHVEALAADLIAILNPVIGADRVLRLLEVIDPLLSPALALPLSGLLEHQSPVVRREVLRAARVAPRPVTLTLARRLLAGSGPEDRDAGIDLAMGMRLTEVGAEIGKILESTDDEKLMIRCCRYFEAAPNAAAVALLTEIVNTKPRLFGLVKGFSPETRAAAEAALAAQGSRPALEAPKNETRSRKAP